MLNNLAAKGFFNGTTQDKEVVIEYGALLGSKFSQVISLLSKVLCYKQFSSLSPN